MKDTCPFCKSMVETPFPLKPAFYRITVDEGAIEISIPSRLTEEEIDDLDHLVCGVIARYRRNAKERELAGAASPTA